MALASTIAITEYMMYTPTVVPEGVDEEFATSEEADDSIGTAEESENELNSGEETDKNASNSAETAKTQKTAVDPFSPRGEKEVTINNGDTLASVIGSLGFDKTDVYLASKSLSKVFNLRNLKVGQKILIKGSRDKAGDLALTGLEIRPDYKTKVVVSKTDSGYNSEKTDVPVKKVVRSISGTMSPKSPAYSLKQCGVMNNISADALRGISQIVNIKSSKTPIDFEFLYQEYYDEDGHNIRKPELLYAAVLVNGKIRRIYKFSYGKSSDFIDSNGMILSTLAKSRSMLTQPLSRMKVTSRFGFRIHPISGRRKGHTGVDLSAPVGTPIHAAASGVVSKASYYAGYGRYVNIRHSGTISTAYGHLSRIVVRSGQHVTKGQIIGYTGASGRVTGAHLHYEVIKNGRFINPLSFVKQDPQKLTGDSLYKFNQFKKQINLQVVGLSQTKNKRAKVHKFS